LEQVAVLLLHHFFTHGDDLVICDTNFPADSVARQTVLGKVLRIDNTPAAEAARAILAARNGTALDPAVIFPTVEDGLKGMQFIDAAVKS
jgi:L-fucose mutarotase/ribose pyranase (RbsD/FucU family)